MDGADIGAAAEYLSGKSEAARRKNDIDLDVSKIGILYFFLFSNV
nr:hypothetical protein [Mesorhizobium sp.]